MVLTKGKVKLTLDGTKNGGREAGGGGGGGGKLAEDVCTKKECQFHNA